MKQEQYTEKIKEINEKINSLKSELKELEKSYIEVNKKFNIREKVILGKGTKKERFAFVSYIQAPFGKIEYSFCKIRKNNTMSQITDYLFFNETISKID